MACADMEGSCTYGQDIQTARRLLKGDGGAECRRLGVCLAELHKPVDDKQQEAAE